MIVAFCGHSTYRKTEADEKRVLELLEHLIGDNACDFFLGEYGQFDRFAYHCAQKFKKTHALAKLIFISPYLPTADFQKMCPPAKERFDLVLYPELEHIPPRYAILHRNRWIVEQADILIAYVTHQFGGAHTMYQYAERKHKKIYNLASSHHHNH